MIPKTGPVSLGDLKNETGAATASFSDPRIQRRLIKDGKFVDLLGYNPPMSLGDFRGSVVTCHKYFNEEGVAPKRDEWGCYKYNPTGNGYNFGRIDRNVSSSYDAARAWLNVTGLYPYDIALYASMNAYCPTATDVEWKFYWFSNSTTRNIIDVYGWSSGWRQGTNVQLFNSDSSELGSLPSGDTTVSFTTSASHPWITLNVVPVMRYSSSSNGYIYVSEQGKSGGPLNWNNCEAREK